MCLLYVAHFLFFFFPFLIFYFLWLIPLIIVAEYCVKQIDIVAYLILSAYIWLFLIWLLCMLWSLKSKNVFLFSFFNAYFIWPQLFVFRFAVLSVAVFVIRDRFVNKKSWLVLKCLFLWNKVLLLSVLFENVSGSGTLWRKWQSNRECSCFSLWQAGQWCAV